MFSLCGLISYMSFLKNPSFGRYLAVVVLVLLSFMSKPTAMCFPLLALSIAYLLRKLDKRVWLSLIPLFVMSVGLGLLTIHSQGNPTNAIAVSVYDTLFSWRVLNAVVSLGLYAWYTVCPLGIHIDYLAVFNGWPTDVISCASSEGDVVAGSRGGSCVSSAWGDGWACLCVNTTLAVDNGAAVVLYYAPVCFWARELR